MSTDAAPERKIEPTPTYPPGYLETGGGAPYTATYGTPLEQNTGGIGAMNAARTPLVEVPPAQTQGEKRRGSHLSRRGLLAAAFAITAAAAAKPLYDIFVGDSTDTPTDKGDQPVGGAPNQNRELTPAEQELLAAFNGELAGDSFLESLSLYAPSIDPNTATKTFADGTFGWSARSSDGSQSLDLSVGYRFTGGSSGGEGNDGVHDRWGDFSGASNFIEIPSSDTKEQRIGLVTGDGNTLGRPGTIAYFTGGQDSSVGAVVLTCRFDTPAFKEAPLDLQNPNPNFVYLHSIPAASLLEGPGL